jgi:hypothetical protein
VITASEPSWIASITSLSPRQFGKLITVLRRKGADAVRKGRPWRLPLEDRILLVAAYWRTNLTLRQLALLFGVSKSAADRVIDHLGPALALQQHKRFRTDTMLIVDGTLVPTRDHTIAEQSKNYRYSTNHQVVIDDRQRAGRTLYRLQMFNERRTRCPPAAPPRQALAPCEWQAGRYGLRSHSDQGGAGS